MELDHEFHGPPSKGIIDTTKPSSERTKRGDANEALAVEFVKGAVANDEVLKIMAGDDWNLEADYKISSHRAGLIAAPLVLFKRIVRRSVRFYTDFLVTRQSRVNSYLVRLCTQLVRERVRSQIESAREIEGLKDMLEKQKSKLSSAVAAINARSDNNEARLDLLRSEFEVRAEVMREELESDEPILTPGDVLRDSAPIDFPTAELIVEDREARAVSLGIDATIAKKESLAGESGSESEPAPVVDAEKTAEAAPPVTSVSANDEIAGDSGTVKTEVLSAGEDTEL